MEEEHFNGGIKKYGSARCHTNCANHFDFMGKNTNIFGYVSLLIKNLYIIFSKQKGVLNSSNEHLDCKEDVQCFAIIIVHKTILV
jgi:hypothetical protein